MINVIMRGLLGEFGSKILDFYIANSFVINFLLLVYAAIVVLGNHARHKIEDALLDYFNATYGQDLSNKKETWFRKMLEQNQPDWERLGKSTWIPFISKRKSIGWRFKTEKSIEAIFTAEYISNLFEDKGNSTD